MRSILSVEYNTYIQFPTCGSGVGPCHFFSWLNKVERDGLWKGRGKQVQKEGMNIFLQGSTYATKQVGIVVASPLQGFSTAILSESDGWGEGQGKG